MTHPLQSYVEPFIQSLRDGRRVQETTIIQYGIEIREFMRVVKNPLELHGVKTYLGMKKPTTHSRKLTIWNAFLETCDEPWRSCLKAFKHPKILSKIPIFYSEDEIKKLFSVACDARERVLLTLGFQLGLRRDELTNLKFSSIEDNYLKIRRKGDHQQRLPLNESQIKLLSDFQGQLTSEDFILRNYLGKRLSNAGITGIFKSILKRAGLKGSLHSMRHSFATSLADSGANIIALKELLGHSSVVTTQRYVHITPNHLRDALDLLNRKEK